MTQKKVYDKKFKIQAVKLGGEISLARRRRNRVSI